MFLRALLVGMLSRGPDPIGDVDRMADDFRSSSGFIRIDGEGVSEDRAEYMRELIRARGAENFDAIRSRIFRDIEVEAAKAGKRN